MTTETSGEADSTRLAHKAVVARSYVDPLGAKGFRQPFARIERERKARRLTVLAALSSFAALFGVFVATAPDPVPAPAAEILAPASERSVIAEIPVPGTNPGDPGTIIRIVAPDVQEWEPVRSRSS